MALFELSGINALEGQSGGIRIVRQSGFNESVTLKYFTVNPNGGPGSTWGNTPVFTSGWQLATPVAGIHTQINTPISDYEAIYESNARYLTFSPGETVKTVSIETFHDGLSSPQYEHRNELANVYFIAGFMADGIFREDPGQIMYASVTGDGATLSWSANRGTSRAGAGFLIQDTGTPSPSNYAVSALNSATEGSTITFRISRSGNISTSGSVLFNVSDYSANYLIDFVYSDGYRSWAPREINFTPGESIKDISFTALADSIAEGTESFYAFLTRVNSLDTITNISGPSGFISDIAPAAVPLTNNYNGSPYSGNSIIINGNNNVVNIGGVIGDNNNTAFNLTSVTTVNKFSGTTKRDSITGTSLADNIDGGRGNDWLTGGDGGDSLSGSAGNDILYGGTGKNTLNGGAGRDSMYVQAEGQQGLADIIQGFDKRDRLYIQNGGSITFNTVDSGMGVFSNGNLEAVITDNVFSTNQLARMVFNA
jgi:Ca2+-binding RTX toxin-like protein